jgi:hypothetical protein
VKEEEEQRARTALLRAAQTNQIEEQQQDTAGTNDRSNEPRQDTSRANDAAAQGSEQVEGPLEEATAVLLRSSSASADELACCRREWKARLMQVRACIFLSPVIRLFLLPLSLLPPLNAHICVSKWEANFAAEAGRAPTVQDKRHVRSWYLQVNRVEWYLQVRIVSA